MVSRIDRILVGPSLETIFYKNLKLLRCPNKLRVVGCPSRISGMKKTNAVLLLFLLLIFAAPVVGQEAGQSARGGVVPGILGSVDPMSRIEGVITPDLQQLEMEDGTIIARDDLIDPEYFVADRGTTVLYNVVAMVALAAGVEWLRRTDLVQTGAGTNFDLQTDGYSWPLVIGLGVGIGIPVGIMMGEDPKFAEGEWTPWISGTSP